MSPFKEYVLVVVLVGVAALLAIYSLSSCVPAQQRPTWDCIKGIDGDSACWDVGSIERHGELFSVKEKIVFKNGEELYFYVRGDCRRWTGQALTLDLEPMGPATVPAEGGIVDHFMKKYCAL
jgi:hypothetical protein